MSPAPFPIARSAAGASIFADRGRNGRLPSLNQNARISIGWLFALWSLIKNTIVEIVFSYYHAQHGEEV
jgi:hypothetical protein